MPVFGQFEEVLLSDFPRLGSETADNGRIKRWLDAGHRAVHRWAGVLEIASPGILEHRPRDIRGVRGTQGNAITGTTLVPVGKWDKSESVLTFTSATQFLTGLNIQVAVKDGLAEDDPGHGLVFRKCHGSQIKDVTVYGLWAGVDPESNASKRRWRGAQRAAVYTDYFNSGTLSNIRVRNVGGIGVLLTQTNGLRADLYVIVSNGDGIVVWSGRPHPWTIYPGASESGSGLELRAHCEGLDGWALRCQNSHQGTLLGGYFERTEGGIWLAGSRNWSLRMPRAGRKPLRLTGSSWDTHIDWLVGNGSFEYPDGVKKYSPIELGYYWSKTEGGQVRVPVPKSWISGLDNARYSSTVGHNIRPDIVRLPSDM